MEKIYFTQLYGLNTAVEKVENPIRYAGAYFDSESGMYYLKARYYDPVTAQFISSDSKAGTIANPETLNLYDYCLDNPVKYTDPDGHESAALSAMASGRIGYEYVNRKVSPVEAFWARQIWMLPLTMNPVGEVGEVAEGVEAVAGTAKSLKFDIQLFGKDTEVLESGMQNDLPPVFAHMKR